MSIEEILEQLREYKKVQVQKCIGLDKGSREYLEHFHTARGITSAIILIEGHIKMTAQEKTVKNFFKRIWRR